MSDNTKNDRKKVAVSEQTYDKLKTFSRLNGLKLRLVIESMADVILKDEELSKRIVDLSLEKDPKNTLTSE